MFHFETIDSKNKKIVFEDDDLKTILKRILNHNTGKGKDDDEADVIFEDTVGNILQTVSEKYLKHILGIAVISRKTAKLEKSSETFKKLKTSDIATITFKNKTHDGVVTIWDEENTSQNDSEDDLDRELEEAMIDDSDSDDESIKINVKKSETTIEKENKRLKEENERLKEEIRLLKSFVVKYRSLSLKLNEDVSKSIKFE